MRLAFFGVGDGLKAATVAVKNKKEAKMRVWTTLELFRLTQTELFQLYAKITAALVDIPLGSYRRGIALGNLERIRRVLTRMRPS